MDCGGTIDGTLRLRYLSSWDLVAGALLIQEAGGTVTDLDGSMYRLETRNMLCSNGNPVVHKQLLDILRQADAVSFVTAATVTDQH